MSDLPKRDGGGGFYAKPTKAISRHGSQPCQFAQGKNKLTQAHSQQWTQTTTLMTYPIWVKTVHSVYCCTKVVSEKSTSTISQYYNGMRRIGMRIGIPRPTILKKKKKNPEKPSSLSLLYALIFCPANLVFTRLLHGVKTRWYCYWMLRHQIVQVFT